MSKPSARKLKKQKERERHLAKKKHEVAEHQLYARKFPAFEFLTNNAPDGFVDLIRRTVREIDFRDTTVFHPNETKFLKQIKRLPGVLVPALNQAVTERNFTALHLSTFVGERIFSRISLGELKQWIPFHDVHFFMAGDRIVVYFRSLEQVKTNHGAIYFSPNRPTVEIDGRKLIVGWSRHAIERTCERLAPRWDSYLGLADVFSFFFQCRRFDPCLLHGDRQLGFTFFDRCAPGYFSGYVAEQVLGRPSTSNCYYRVGYCPVVVDGPFAKAMTLLYPGYAGTPEYGLILRNGLPGKDRPQVVEMASRMTREELEKTQDYSLMKMFHQNGVPQIIESDEDFYPTF